MTRTTAPSLWPQTAPWVLLSATLMALPFTFPASPEFLVSWILAIGAGGYPVMMGKTARLPLIVIGIYPVGALFPAFINAVAACPYTDKVIVPLRVLATLAGLPVGIIGNKMRLTTFDGYLINATLTTGCAGGPPWVCSSLSSP